MSELTQKEFARMGANATNSKYPQEQRREWAKKGPEALKAKYGPDYFKNLAKKGRETKEKQKQDQIRVLTKPASEI